MFYASNCNTKLTLKNFPGRVPSLHSISPCSIMFRSGSLCPPFACRLTVLAALTFRCGRQGASSAHAKNSAANSSAAAATLHSAAPFFGMLLFPCNCSIKIGLRRTVSLNLHRCRMQTADAIRLFFIAKL